MNQIKIKTFNCQDQNIEQFRNIPQQIYTPPPSPEHISEESTCWLAVTEDGVPLARLTTQIVTDLYGTEGESGLIGHYEALDSDAGVALLEEAKQWFVERKVKRVLGPMNGNTWERYRLALPQENGEPFFLGEPRNPPEYPKSFEKAGFLPVDFYESRVTDDLTTQQDKIGLLESKLEKRGISVHTVQQSQFDLILQSVYDLSVQSFSQNRFYRNISFSHFKALYEPIQPLLDPDFVKIARDRNDHVVGVLLGFPDLYSIVDGKPQQLVFKTIAVSPEMRGSGLGIYLFDLLHLTAYKRGYRRVIHALMHCDNVSLKMSVKRNHSVPLRKYALYQWEP